MIKCRLQPAIEKQYCREVRRLCKTSAFGMAVPDDRVGGPNRNALENVVVQAKTTARLLSSLVLGIGPTSLKSKTSDLNDMKLVAILAILCRSAHRNNSNYLPLMIGLYLYSAGARVDAITLLNRLGLSVSYDVLQKSLRNITLASQAWIKEQATNCKLVGTWDNFEYRENVHDERVGDTVKFRSVTMALWIKNGWRIPIGGLKQSMWDSNREFPDTVDLLDSVYGPAGAFIRDQCICCHQFNAFRVAFPEESLEYNLSMPAIDIIDCKTKGATEAYAFAPSMFSESSTVGNMSVFEDLNVNQMGIDKIDPRWDDWLTIWWGDLKTKVQMLSMQSHGMGIIDRSYDRYQHLFPGLALWHLRFNYLKMVRELFYPGGSATERSTLQWAADHWHRDKTTRPTDFHSLEDLTIHSYRARIIAILKPWIQDRVPALRMHDHKELGIWISKLTPTQWAEALDWLGVRMQEERASLGGIWNDHWNNHVRFCSIMEPYMTLCWSIKHGDTGLLKYAMREICIILQAPATRKPKYARELLRQVHIFDTSAADPVLQKVYLANALVNPRGLGHTFYEMDLLLEYQNGEFKRFRSNRDSSLQESNEMFRLHALSVDALRKVRSSLNKVIIGRERSGYHPTKDSLFDILSLANQLH